MGAEIAEKQGHDAEGCPLVYFRDVDHVDVYEEGEGPHLTDGSSEGQLAPDLGDVGQCHHCDHFYARSYASDKKIASPCGYIRRWYAVYDILSFILGE